MPACYFCGRSPAPSLALTRLRGDPKKIGSLCRHVLPLCGRCHKALVDAALEGRKLKETSERWYAGHVVGRFESKGAPVPLTLAQPRRTIAAAAASASWHPVSRRS